MARPTRGQVATAIKNFRYAVKSGACTVAHYHLRTVADAMPNQKTWSRLMKVYRACKRNPALDRRSRRRRR